MARLYKRMSKGQVDFVNQPKLPEKLTTQEVGWLLGFPKRDIPTLVKADLLKPISELPGRRIYFSLETTQKLIRAPDWMSKATDVADAAHRAEYQKRKLDATK